MRTFTTEHTVYTFDELSETAKQNALDRLRDINVEYEWWDNVYEDAARIGLRLTDSDIDHYECNGILTDSLQDVCKAILAEHGETCDTYQLALKWQFKHGEDNEQEFLTELLKLYLQMLREEYEYATSEEAIIEAIECNGYEFTENGERA